MKLDLSQLLSYERAGHLTTRGLLPKVRVAELRRVVRAAYSARELDAHRQKVRVLLGDDALQEVDASGGSSKRKLALLKRALAAVDPDDIPFMQLFNLWPELESVASLLRSPEMAGTARVDNQAIADYGLMGPAPL